MKAAVRWAWLVAATVGTMGTVASGAWQQLDAQATGGKPRPVPVPGAVMGELPPGVTGTPASPRIPTTFDELFAERDARAIDALNYLRCLRGTLRAIQTGVLGQVPRGWTLVCVEQKGEWRGVLSQFVDGEPGVMVQRQFAMRGSGTVVTDAIDTANVAGIARALLRGVAAPSPGKGQYEYLPVPLRQPTFIELWYVPVPSDPSRAVVGGDSLIQLSVDGTRELGHSRTTPPIRTFSVAPGSSYLLMSREERIPLLSELMVAHMALSVAPDVRVRTQQFESVFSRSTTAVTHVRR
jgi:hypothetical protein